MKNQQFRYAGNFASIAKIQGIAKFKIFAMHSNFLYASEKLCIAKFTVPCILRLLFPLHPVTCFQHPLLFLFLLFSALLFSWSLIYDVEFDSSSSCLDRLNNVGMISLQKLQNLP